MNRQSTSIRSHTKRQSFEFILLFNRAVGSERVFYFMVDPRTGDRMFPKLNTTVFHKLRNLVGYRVVVTDDQLYIIGGKDWMSGEATGATWRYNPDTGKWTACAKLHEPRCRFTADVLDGKIFVTGGEVRHGKVTDHVEFYDPQADTWTPIKLLPRPRVDHASCVAGNRLYVSGGIPNIKHQCSNVFWVYDVLTDVWSDPCPRVHLPQDREKHSMVTYKKDIIVFGGRGFDQEVFQEKDESRVVSYSTRQDGQSARPRAWDLEHPHMYHNRVSPGSVLLGMYFKCEPYNSSYLSGKRIYFFGGKSYQKDQECRDVDFYTPKTRKWRTVFSLPPRYSYANAECVRLTVPIHNRDFNFNDILLYDHWIMW
ncbi:kelch-like protein 26 [Mya arenaria]|uniref:kelch-like protein 26 n=1 Tax=Mya arenaria TaxID=6604 RepID=UPI0022E125DA|nr:kelch-like protein 26 [Mya arenaria]